MIGDHINDDAKPVFVSRFDEFFCIAEGTKNRVHIAVVGHVVAGVFLGRGVKRRKPERVHAKICDVRQFGNNAWDITNTITV